MAPAERNVYLTVGTTDFDNLVKAVTSQGVCEVLRRHGYTRLLLQIGRGQFEPKVREVSDSTPAVEFYRFKDSITEDIGAASLVISHAGAGSVLETLGAGQPLLVVVNDDLMGNHQVELARQLQQLGHLHYCTCSTLKETLDTADFSTLRPFTPGNPEAFTSHLSSLLTCGSADVAWSKRFLFHLSWVSVMAVLLLLVYPS